MPPPGYVSAVRELCTRERIILILDEVQTGLGRTGKLLAEEHEGVESDMTLLGKALGGGFYPVSAVLCSGPIMDVLRPGEHGSTFGGNPLACAVARASLRAITEEGMVENSAAMGAYFREGLNSIGSRIIKEVRGPGIDAGAGTAPRCGRRAALLRGAEASRHPLQGHERAHDPHLAAARHYARRHRQGAVSVRRGVGLTGEA